MIALLKGDSLAEIVSSSDCLYVQNVTPAVLLFLLGAPWKGKKQPPKNILDLCASPGGKLVGVHNLFPEALLSANDVSEEKLKRLRERIAWIPKLEALLSCGQGENFSSNIFFDIVVVDAPCSNTGVLNKRSEARWRLSPEQIAQLKNIQLQLLEKAKKLLTPNGEVWYMTCSILKKENEELVEEACHRLGFKLKTQKIVLPNHDGWEGGFAASLMSSTSEEPALLPYHTRTVLQD